MTVLAIDAGTTGAAPRARAQWCGQATTTGRSRVIRDRRRRERQQYRALLQGPRQVLPAGDPTAKSICPPPDRLRAGRRLPATTSYRPKGMTKMNANTIQ